MRGDGLVWERDGRDWPNRQASRFVVSGGLRWHVQQFGSGPPLLLVHGTGAATHSWRGLAPLLAGRFTLLAPDLPGHGFTELPAPEELSLRGMASALERLLGTLGVQPALVAGHSAGAAILARMCLDQAIAPRALVSLNGALLPLRGVAGQFFSPVAKLLATTSITSQLFAWRAGSPGAIERLIQGTGSKIEPAGVELYRKLAQAPQHVAAALGMMARWDLRSLERELPRLRQRLVLIAGESDRTISPQQARQVMALVPTATAVFLPGLGHLAHEEQPQKVAQLIADQAAPASTLNARAASS